MNEKVVIIIERIFSKHCSGYIIIITVVNNSDFAAESCCLININLPYIITMFEIYRVYAHGSRVDLF